MTTQDRDRNSGLYLYNTGVFSPDKDVSVTLKVPKEIIPDASAD